MDAPTKAKCKQKVYDRAIHQMWQCGHPANKDGFCGIHRPDKAMARNVKWEAKYAAIEKAAQHREDIRKAERAVIDAAKVWGETAFGDKESENTLIDAVAALRVLEPETA